LTSFFYHKAKEENPDITDESFRYDGLRPQSKEAALVLLADNVEAAVRSHKGNTPGRIEGLVRKIIKDKFDEGLLDQCDLTFKDLDKISTAFVKVLSGIFHSRVEYPELPSAKKTLEEKNQVREEENDVIDELEVAEIEQETMSEEVNDLQAAEDSQEATDADQESSDVGGSDNKGT